MTEHAQFLIGRQVYLRPVEPDDLERYYRWMNDREVTRWTTNVVPIPLPAERQWIEDATKSRPTTKHVFSIVLTKEDLHIGVTGIHAIDWVSRVGTTGIVIGDRSCWRRGYGFEAKMLVLRYAFATLNLRKLLAAAMEGNAASQRNLRKQGYREVGRFTANAYRDGAYYDEILFELFAGDFAKVWEEHRERMLPAP